MREISVALPGVWLTYATGDGVDARELASRAVARLASVNIEADRDALLPVIESVTTESAAEGAHTISIALEILGRFGDLVVLREFRPEVPYDEIFGAELPDPFERLTVIVGATAITDNMGLKLLEDVEIEAISTGQLLWWRRRQALLGQADYWTARPDDGRPVVLSFRTTVDFVTFDELCESIVASVEWVEEAPASPPIA